MSTEPPLRLYREANGHSVASLARLVGVNRSTFLRWEERRVPAERVLDVERVTGVPRHELRPDLYPAPTLAPAASGENDNPAVESLTPEECGE